MSTETPAVGRFLQQAEKSLTARVMLNSFLAEIFYLPYLIANNVGERIAIERHLNQLLNLQRARDEGLIRNWTIQWRQIRQTGYPTRPRRIFIYAPEFKPADLFLTRPVMAEMRRIRLNGLMTRVTKD